VRQKTVSAGAEEVKNMVGANTPPAAPAQPNPAIQVTPAPKNTQTTAFDGSQDDDTFDPLGAFLQDLDAAPEKAVAPAEPHSTKAIEDVVDLFEDDNDDNDEDDDDLDDFDLDIFEDPDLDEEEQDKSTTAPSDELEEPLDDDLRDELDDLLQATDDDEVEYKAEAEVVEPAPPVTRQETVQRGRGALSEQQQQVSRQPDSRQSRPGPVEPKQQTKRDVQPAPTRDSKVTQSPPAVRPGQPPIRPRIGGMPQRSEMKTQSAPGQQVVTARAEAPMSSPRSADPREQSVRVMPVASPTSPKTIAPSSVQAGRGKAEIAGSRNQTTSAGDRVTERGEGSSVRPGKMKPGRLFGWLVSYENPDGRAIELRAGRFFVTGTSIRGTDLILEDQSISTPHALMVITENGLQLQDLMSERGTFVRPQGEAQYSREDGVVEIRHGDWIRFGDVEFLVTIVPS
jgi:hypothetical protein